MDSSNDAKIENLVRIICTQASVPGLGVAVRCGTPTAKQILSNLNELARLLANELHLESDPTYRVKPTSGYGNLPRVLWIAILKRGQIVSSSLALVICFGRHGNGMVVGLMEPLDRLSRPILKRKSMGTDDERFIDVSSRSSRAVRYNERFFDYRDFPLVEFDSKKLINYLREKVDTLRALEERVNA